ncbi:MAG: hypothetical protein NT154_32410, partial [Verrucomicrobia bacterium]|nr:hypothetical protein [Verrucomicrobiota bacterium]
MPKIACTIPPIATFGSGRFTTNVTVHRPVPTELVADSTTAYVPAWLGCPVIKPETRSIAKPGGRPLAPEVVAPFKAMI